MRAHAGAFQRSPRAYQHVLHKQWAKRLLNKRGYCSARQNSTPTCLLDKWQQSTFFFLLYFCLLIVLSLFSACTPSTFKSKFGEGNCVPCPSNSRTSARGANICPCQTGFYRADTDPPDSACTSKSKKKTKQKTRAAQTLVEVCWQFFFFYCCCFLSLKYGVSNPRSYWMMLNWGDSVEK